MLDSLISSQFFFRRENIGLRGKNCAGTQIITCHFYIVSISTDLYLDRKVDFPEKGHPLLLTIVRLKARAFLVFVCECQSYLLYW